jgi:hypothetical protein
MTENKTDPFPWRAVWAGPNPNGRQDQPQRFSWNISGTNEGRERLLAAFGQVPTFLFDPRG